jgi:hypothetical protein
MRTLLQIIIVNIDHLNVTVKTKKKKHNEVLI